MYSLKNTGVFGRIWIEKKADWPRLGDICTFRKAIISRCIDMDYMDCLH